MYIKGEVFLFRLRGGRPFLTNHLHRVLYSALLSKAWEALSSKDCLWRPFLSKMDPMSALGEDRLQALSLQYSCKQVIAIHGCINPHPRRPDCG